MSTCAELPEFSASIHPAPEECQDPDPCGDGGDEEGGESGGEGSASRLMCMGATVAVVVSGLAIAALQF